jgi:hypothetical protein
MEKLTLKGIQEVKYKMRQYIWRNGGRIAFCLMLAFITGMGSYGIAQSQDAKKRDPLIDILIRKGVITKQEAEEIEKEAGELENQRQEKIVKEIKDKKLAVPKGLKGVKVGMLGYVDYSYGDEPEPSGGESDLNRFKVTRTYLTVKKEILPWFHARVTLDAHQDDTEDFKVRLKYYYAELRPSAFGFLTDMKSEVGMGHGPWLDFEEHINPYRCQGTMAIERAGTFNSADLGISLRGYFGGKLEDAEEKTGSHYYDGHYGSWHVGVYNGPGYHASEKNNNKVIEGRFTLRPLPEVIPGLQLTYLGYFGEGNDDSNPAGDFPDYEVNLGMLSYQNPCLTFTAQYFLTEGNMKGTWVDLQGDALDTKGYSIFTNVKLPVLEKKLSLFGRYDYFDQDDDSVIVSDADFDLYNVGLAYNFYKSNLVMLVYETTDYGENAGKKGKLPGSSTDLGDDSRVQVVLQIKF